jgi:hypothetical protein
MAEFIQSLESRMLLSATTTDPSSGGSTDAVSAAMAAVDAAKLQMKTDKQAFHDAKKAADAAFHTAKATDLAAIKADLAAIRADASDPTQLATDRQQLATDRQQLKSDVSAHTAALKSANVTWRSTEKADNLVLKQAKKSLHDARHAAKAGG